MAILRFYKTPGLRSGQCNNKLNTLKEISKLVVELETEICYNIEASEDYFTPEELDRLKWILGSPFEPNKLRNDTAFIEVPQTLIIEIGPRFEHCFDFTIPQISMPDY